MGLFMKYEDMWDMNIGGVEHDREIPHWFGNLAYALVGGAYKMAFRYRVDGRENLRAFKGEQGVVVVSNHKSFHDVVLMYLAVRPSQWVRIMGRDTLFGNAHGLLGQILSRTGAFPVKRDSADMSAVKRAVRMLKNGEVVGVFPEGTRRGKSDRVPQLYSGVSAIARMAKAPILPMAIRNVENIKRKGERARFPKVTVEYGDPIVVSDFNFLPKEDRLDGCTWYVMRECFALFDNVAPEQVDMAALFPETKDFTEVFAEHPIAHHTSEELVREARLERRKKEERKSDKAAQGTDSRDSCADA